ncbi:MAG: restriction endonuclease subunit S [Candidatus Eisenbacteria sp.]|nr:restriction endonuclease subunit S [Candidatus Eisenbacteria bacterium]
MIDGLKPYSGYKDSGVRWLGNVPEHWDVRRQRNVVSIHVSNVDKHTKKEELPVRLCNYIDVYKNELITERIPFMRATATPEEIRRFRLEAGDVLITKDSETWDDIGVPALVDYAAPDLICGYHIALLRPRAGLVVGSYLLRVLQSPPVAYQYYVSANGVTRYGLSHHTIKSVVVPLPPLPEQFAIVRFLDHADRRIRRYIRARKRVITLLEEQKQAIIHQAVTRGLDASVQLRPSGIEWLGDVPAHWQVMPLGMAAVSIQTGPFGSQLHASDYVTGGTPVINPSHMYDGRIHGDPSVSVSETRAQDLDRHRFRSGDVVAARRGELGRCALVEDEQEGWLCGTGSLCIRLRGELLISAYLVRVFSLSAIRDSLGLLAIGATMANLNASMMARLPVPLPPLAEQRGIVELVENKILLVEDALDASQHEIKLLRELRAKIIADVVSGKVDVRKVAASLPSEADEPELPDEADDLADEGDAMADDPDAVPEETEA